MGRLGHELVISHFSHPHSLELTSLHHDHHHQPAAAVATCAGCALSISGDDFAYSCKPCGYTLHLACAQMPQRISHPADSVHRLTLLAGNSSFSSTCAACGGAVVGGAFFYHCRDCNLNLHCACAALPLSVAHGGHLHPLTLFFLPPYENKSFSCDVCEQPGSFQWVYGCAMCGFDAHVGCATARETAVQGYADPATTTGLRMTLQKLESGLGDKRRAKKVVKKVAVTVGASLLCTIL
ncbi:hypothetical protein Cni_G25632 [Canna indica]|uniref:DC1 domain-containing protein n=1 Tax=Canna indica TaxID=4628 RepID=A0AAQ3QMK8_9LILI|nr:hypothetical protein Cni_G25632 [Canna indica]